jgi:hypothetical protein
MTDPQNRRDFTRVPLAIEAEVRAGDRVIVPDQTRDLCMRGLYLRGGETLPLQSSCEVRIFPGGRESGAVVEACARVVRVDSEGMALEFTEILGGESYTHLRNLVLANAEDAGTVEQEFQSHLGIRRPD